MSATAINEAAGRVRAALDTFHTVRADETADLESQASAFRALEGELRAFDAVKALESVPAEGDERDAEAAAPARRGAPSLARELATSQLIRESHSGRFGATEFDRSLLDIYVGKTGTNASDIAQIEYVEDFIRAGLPAPTFWDWVVKRPVTKEIVSFAKRVAYENNAAVVPHRADNDFGAVSRSTARWARVQATVGKIGDSFRTDRDALEDVDFMEGEIDELLRFSLPHLISAHALSATQVAGSPVSSIRAGAGASAGYAVGETVNDTAGAALDALLDARVSARLAGRSAADSVFLSPIAHARLLQLKDGEGRYRVGNPFGTGSIQTIWGMTPVESEQLVDSAAVEGALDQFVVLPQRDAVKAYVRRGIELQTSENVDDDFLRDAVVVKATSRLVIPILNDAAIVKVDGATNGS